jgi:hypothetical protein
MNGLRMAFWTLIAGVLFGVAHMWLSSNWMQQAGFAAGTTRPHVAASGPTGVEPCQALAGRTPAAPGGRR